MIAERADPTVAGVDKSEAKIIGVKPERGKRADDPPGRIENESRSGMGELIVGVVVDVVIPDRFGCGSMVGSSPVSAIVASATSLPIRDPFMVRASSSPSLGSRPMMSSR